MNNKIKNVVTTFVFVVFIAFFAVICCTRFVNPVEYSDVEKREMAQLPEDFTLEQLLNNKEYVDQDGVTQKAPIKQFESFAVDQFPFREFFRSIKSNFALRVLGLKENNGYAMEDGSIVEVKTEFNQEIVDYQIGRLEYMYEQFLKGNGGKHYVALVPDKNYYFGEDYGYITPNYDAMIEQVKNTLAGMEYIDLFDSLELSDYYKTDWHWDQSKLEDSVLVTLGNAMGFADRLSGQYTENFYDDFRGGYYDQSALFPPAEKLTYLTNEVLDGCTVYDYEDGKSYGLYNHELYTSKTPYDFFLSGTRALLRIDNPAATTDDTLIVFRDSYGASLVPLMAEGYASIYVVDLRYVHPNFVTGMLGADAVEGADVLFMLSTTVLNSKTFK